MFSRKTFDVEIDMLIWLCIVFASSANNIITGAGVVQNGAPFLEVNFANETNITFVTIPTTRIPEHQKLQVVWKNSSTTSIAISWKFILDPSIRNDTFDGSIVECFYKNGKFVSNMLHPWVNTYVFNRLEVDTSYTICISAYERKTSGTIIHPTMQYSKCVILSTIPYVRRDSVVVLLCTMSYFLFLSLLGVSQWKHKVREIKERRQRYAIEDDNPDESMQPIHRQENGKRHRSNKKPESAIEETAYR